MKYLSKIDFGKYAFVHFLIIRVLSVWVVQTWYVPDEYWQSLEVAHNYVFGYGHLTWEWRQGVRSFVHPFLIAAIYKIIALVNLDTVDVLIFTPRIAQAVLSAYADFCFYKWTGRKKWAMFCISTNWFWFYTASRTLINTFETSLTIIALSMYPWRGSKREAEVSTFFLWIVAALVTIRPTAAIQWIPLCIFHLKNNWKLIGYRYVPIGIVVMLIGVVVDSLAYGGLVVTSWEFFKVNVLNEIGSFYGALPLYWYFTVGFPTILGVHMLPFSWAAIKIIQNWKAKFNQMQLLVTILFTLCVYSFLPHKEFRFILPLVPMALYISVDFLSPWSLRTSRLYIWLTAVTLLTASCAPIYYLSRVHQRGALDVMPILNEIAVRRPKSASFLFLMPCHSTPLYSHLHVNVTVKFLTCEPNLDNVENYKDEADQFYEDPRNWLAQNYPENASLPSHIIVFDHLSSESSIFARYNEIHKLHHTDVPSGRVGRYIIVHQHAHFEQH